MSENTFEKKIQKMNEWDTVYKDTYNSLAARPTDWFFGDVGREYYRITQEYYVYEGSNAKSYAFWDACIDSVDNYRSLVSRYREETGPIEEMSLEDLLDEERVDVKYVKKYFSAWLVEKSLTESKDEWGDYSHDQYDDEGVEIPLLERFNTFEEIFVRQLGCKIFNGDNMMTYLEKMKFPMTEKVSKIICYLIGTGQVDAEKDDWLYDSEVFEVPYRTTSRLRRIVDKNHYVVDINSHLIKKVDNNIIFKGDIEYDKRDD